MSTIQRLTRTHADLEAELSQFARLLKDADAEPETDAALTALRDEIETVQRTLERHIASEVSLEERSDFILGEGSMKDYGVPAHHKRMRAAVAMLRESVSTRPDRQDLNEQFASLLEQFDRYTEVELQFLRENGAILFPGGASS